MDHKVFEYKLKGGGKGLVVHIPGSRVVDMDLTFNSGYIFSNHSKFEIPHVLEHMMGRESKRYPEPLEYKLAVEKNGAYRNAYTDSYTNYYILECIEDEGNKMLDLLTDQIGDVLLTNSSLETEVGNVREELNGYVTNHGHNNIQKLFTKILPDSNEDYEPRIEQLDRITVKDILAYYKKFYSQRNLSFFLAGNFPDKGRSAVALLETSLNKLPVGEEHPILPELLSSLDKPLLTKAQIKQLYYNLIVCIPSLSPRQVITGRLLSSLLTNGAGSWINRVSREKGIAYAVGTHYEHSYHQDSFSIWYNVTPKNSMELFKLFTEVMVRAKKGNFNSAEISSVVAMIKGQMVRQYQKPMEFLYWYKNDYLLPGNYINDFDTYMKEISTITKDEIVEVANIITSQPWSLALTGDITNKKANELYEVLEPIWK